MNAKTPTLLLLVLIATTTSACQEDCWQESGEEKCLLRIPVEGAVINDVGCPVEGAYVCCGGFCRYSEQNGYFLLMCEAGDTVFTAEHFGETCCEYRMRVPCGPPILFGSILCSRTQGN